jgi:hypothetical protein
MENLPVEAFRVIKSFVGNKYGCRGYLNLMNSCHLLTFHIKKFTIQRITNKTSTLDHIKAIFEKSWNSYHQIRLYFDAQFMSDIELFSFFSKGLYSLTLIKQRFGPNLIVYLKDIRYLQLEDCPTIVSLDGLDNIVNLLLIGLINLVDISAVRQISNLKSILIVTCNAITDLSSLSGIQKVSLRDSLTISLNPKGIQYLGNHRNVFIHFPYSSIERQLGFPDCKNILNLDIYCNSIVIDESLQNILGTLSILVRHSSQFSLTSFQGKYLILTCFNIINKGRIFENSPNLISLTLNNCSNINFDKNSPFILSCIDHLRKVQLSHCSDVTSLTSLTSVHYLKVIDCPVQSLTEFHPTVNSTVIIHDCPLVKEAYDNGKYQWLEGKVVKLSVTGKNPIHST